MSRYDNAVKDLKKLFPRLSSNVQITSPETSIYNCIAFAAGDMSKWWWPDPIGMYYWPPNCIRRAILPAFQMAFQTLGYKLCADGEHSPFIEKVAIFHKDNTPTHAARQIGLARLLWRGFHSVMAISASNDAGDLYPRAECRRRRL